MANSPNQNVFDFDRVTFDLDLGEKEKERGMEQAQASLSRKQLLEIARVCAEGFARRYGEVTNDDVFYEMLKLGLDPTALGNAAGCVFRGNQFIFTGRWTKSKRVSNHASDLRVWKLNHDYVPPKKDVARVANLSGGDDVSK